MSGSLGVKWSKPSFSIAAHSSTEAPETGLQLLLGRSTQQLGEYRNRLLCRAPCQRQFLSVVGGPGRLR